MNIATLADFETALANGPYAWPGGYPLYFVMADGEALSFAAAQAEAPRIREEFAALGDGEVLNLSEWLPLAVEVNWEDAALFCAHTNERIESAYAEDETEA